MNVLEMRSRRRQVTENNASVDKVEYAKTLATIGDTIYCAACEECGESKGTKHIHVFIIFKNAVRGSSIKRLFKRAHCEVCAGDNAQNRDYIVKSDKNPFEIGVCPLNEKADDVAAAVVDLITNQGKKPVEIAMQFSTYANYVVKNYRNLMEIYKSVNE